MTCTLLDNSCYIDSACSSASDTTETTSGSDMSTDLIRSDSCTLQRAVSIWLGTEWPEGHKTRRAYAQAVDSFTAFIADKVGRPAHTLGLDVITRANAMAYQSHCLLIPLAPKTINMRTAALSSFCTYLCRVNPAFINPLGGLKRIPEKGLQFSGINYADVVLLMEALEAGTVWTCAEAEQKHQRLLLAISLMTFYGVRIGAVSGLRMSDIRGDRIHFITKGNTTLDRKLIEPVTSRLTAYLEMRDAICSSSGDWLLTTSTGGQYCQRQIRRDLKSACNAVGINYFNPHKLRHTYARKYIDKTGDVRGLSQLLGHKDINVTMIYTEREQDVLEAAAATIFE